MKINWGTGIAIFYTCFVIAMISMVVKSAQHKPHMVQEKYYQKDLNYESFRSKRENGSLASEQVKVSHLAKEKKVQINFPKDQAKISGKITFFRPSNKYLDKTLELQLDATGSMYIPLDQTFPAGLWRIQIDWQEGGKLFYQEESIVL